MARCRLLALLAVAAVSLPTLAISDVPQPVQLPLLAASTTIPLGAEFTLRPTGAGLCDIVKQPLGLWNTANGALASIDGLGYPTEDAYLIFFYDIPSPLDPLQFVPQSIFGSYLLTWTGQATLQAGPNLNVSFSNVTFDPSTYASSAIATLSPGGAPGLAVGWYESKRNATAPSGSGVTDVHVLAPGCWEDAAAGADFPTWHPDLLKAAGPLSQLRFMEWMDTNSAPNYTSPDHGVLQWTARTTPDDAIWSSPGYIRPGAVGAPWETVITFAQASGKDIWINIPVAAALDDMNYTLALATLLLNGNSDTNGAGVPSNCKVYVEHGNEVWLNGTEGGPGTNFLYNLAAATDEVGRGGSNLNNDGATDPQVWANRRHLRTLWFIAQSFASVFGAAAMRHTILPVFGQFQEYYTDTDAALAWLSTTYNCTPASLIYGIAINSYLIAYVPVGSSPGDMYSAWMFQSDAQLGYRSAMAAVGQKLGGLTLVSYEGNTVGIPAADDNATSSDIIAAARLQPIVMPMKYDLLVNWQALNNNNTGGRNTPDSATGGDVGTLSSSNMPVATGDVVGAYNYYALSSSYGPPPVFQWGLLEDLHNLTGSWKYIGVMQEAEATGR